MSDHPRIDQLPLTMEGVPVREPIREIFCNSENGTPDNISRAGCLALAMKSNQIGGTDKGHVVWNAWRQEFRTTHFYDSVGRSKFRNCVDFSSQNFEEKLNNLRGFNFGDGALFNQSRWRPLTSFDNAVWGKHSQFSGAIWGDSCRFQGARWGDHCLLIAAKWGKNADFSQARWGTFCNFNVAQWGEFSNFSNAFFEPHIDMSNCSWGHDVQFCYTRFNGDIRFTGSTFNGLARFLSSKDAGSFYSIDFNGCEFKGEVDFGQRKFLGKTNFGLTRPEWKKATVEFDEQGLMVCRNDNFPCFKETGFGNKPVVFAKPPLFHGCELHQDTSFEGAVFPKATGSEEAARAYRTLKLAFSEQQSVREEQRFFKLEMQEEEKGHYVKAKQALSGLKLTVFLREGVAWLLYFFYSLLAAYGFSVVRPFALLMTAWLGFAWLYGSYSDIQPCFSWQSNCTFQSEWLNYSLQQALPLPGFDNQDSQDSEPYKVPLWCLALFKIISLTALFLMGLGIRNLFKLK